jgi:hypothetical protein
VDAVLEPSRTAPCASRQPTMTVSGCKFHAERGARGASARYRRRIQIATRAFRASPRERPLKSAVKGR